MTGVSSFLPGHFVFAMRIKHHHSHKQPARIFQKSASAVQKERALKACLNTNSINIRKRKGKLIYELLFCMRSVNFCRKEASVVHALPVIFR